MGVVINFMLHCYRCNTNKMYVGFPWCLRTSLPFAATTTMGVFTHKIYVQGDVSNKPFVHDEIGQSNALQICQWKLSHKELCSKLSSKEIDFYTKKGHFASLRPPWGLEAFYAHWKARTHSCSAVKVVFGGPMWAVAVFALYAGSVALSVNSGFMSAVKY